MNKIEIFENSQKIKHLLGIFLPYPNEEDIVFLLKKWWYVENGENYMKGLKTIKFDEHSICFPLRIFNLKFNSLWKDENNLIFSNIFQKIKETEKETYYILKRSI